MSRTTATFATIMPVALLLCAVGAFSSSCNRAAAQGEGAADERTDVAEKRGEALLARVERVYRQAKSYLDNATFHERFVYRADGLVRRPAPHTISVAFERPNKLQVVREVPAPEGVSGAALRVELRSNGDRTRAYISDLAEQVLDISAPESLTYGSFPDDPLLQQALMPVPIDRLYPQLDLLLATDDSPPKLRELGKPRLLRSDELKGVECYRLQMTAPEGSYVLWIDKMSFLLRRMESPTGQVRAQLDPHDRLSRLELYIDFHDAVIDADIPDATFEMEVPDQARRVSSFEAPPPAADAPRVEQEDAAEEKPE